MRERYSPLAVPTNAVRSSAKRGESATASADRSSRPELAPLQVTPPSSERSTPSWPVPMKSGAVLLEGRRERRRRAPRRPATWRQVRPPSVERKRPVRPATNSVRSCAKAGEAAMASARAGPGSGLIGRQVRPSSERKPPAGVTARRRPGVLRRRPPTSRLRATSAQRRPTWIASPSEREGAHHYSPSRASGWHARDAASSGRASGPPRACS